MWLDVALQESALDQLPLPGAGAMEFDGFMPTTSEGPGADLTRLGSFSEFREMAAALPTGGAGF
jgi:hypothetical protein